MPLSKKRLNSDDVFILDLGLKIFQWNGNGCNKDERFKVGLPVALICAVYDPFTLWLFLMRMLQSKSLVLFPV